MKILYVMRNLWGGGTPKRFWMIYNALAQKGLDITLLSTPNASTYQQFNPRVFSGIKIIAAIGCFDGPARSSRQTASKGHHIV